MRGSVPFGSEPGCAKCKHPVSERQPAIAEAHWSLQRPHGNGALALSTSRQRPGGVVALSIHAFWNVHPDVRLPSLVTEFVPCIAPSSPQTLVMSRAARFLPFVYENRCQWWQEELGAWALVRAWIQQAKGELASTSSCKVWQQPGRTYVLDSQSMILQDHSCIAMQLRPWGCYRVGTLLHILSFAHQESPSDQAVILSDFVITISPIHASHDTVQTVHFCILHIDSASLCLQRDSSGACELTRHGRGGHALADVDIRGHEEL